MLLVCCIKQEKSHFVKIRLGFFLFKQYFCRLYEKCQNTGYLHLAFFRFTHKAICGNVLKFSYFAVRQKKFIQNS